MLGASGGNDKERRTEEHYLVQRDESKEELQEGLKLLKEAVLDQSQSDPPALRFTQNNIRIL